MDRDGMCSLDARVVFIVDASSTGVHVIPLGALKGVSWAILKKLTQDIRLRYYLVLEPSFKKIVIVFDVDFHFWILHDDTLDGDTSLFLSFPLQAGASDNTVLVRAPILKGWKPPLEPNSHLILDEYRFGDWRSGMHPWVSMKLEGFLARMVSFAGVRVRGE